MMVITVKQSEKAHNANQLHQELIDAKLVPSYVGNGEGGMELHFAGGVDEAAVRSIIAEHRPRPAEVPPDFKTLMTMIEQAEGKLAQAEADFASSTTVTQKAALRQVIAAQREVIAAQRAFMKARAGLR